MKKFSLMALAAVLAISLCACGCSADQTPTENRPVAPTTDTTATTPSTTKPVTTEPTTTKPAATDPATTPDMPEMETNIPDPTVNSNSAGDATDGLDDMARSRGRNRTR